VRLLESLEEEDETGIKKRKLAGDIGGVTLHDSGVLSSRRGI